ELWTWTIQGYPPKTPPYVGLVGDDFEPFGVGYVELPGELRVEARLTENDPSLLWIGMPMTLTLLPLTINESGEEVATFAFAPKGFAHE
ncbi:MAG: OB-fold domain-containing protein, partial [Actinomycetota bacterium]|nr:OB-fold domain-containing protein [Actinomycetota bacterium]